MATWLSTEFSGKQIANMFVRKFFRYGDRYFEFTKAVIDDLSQEAEVLKLEFQKIGAVIYRVERYFYSNYLGSMGWSFENDEDELDLMENKLDEISGLIKEVSCRMIFTVRQNEIFDRLLEGLSPAEIQAELKISRSLYFLELAKLREKAVPILQG